MNIIDDKGYEMTHEQQRQWIVDGYNRLFNGDLRYKIKVWEFVEKLQQLKKDELATLSADGIERSILR